MAGSHANGTLEVAPSKEALMNGLNSSLEEATRLVATGEEREALQMLHEAVDATHDPALLREIHELAAMAHESSQGFHKIEWHRLMIDTEQ
jgi:hypothetical protein